MCKCLAEDEKFAVWIFVWRWIYYFGMNTYFCSYYLNTSALWSVIMWYEILYFFYSFLLLHLLPSYLQHPIKTPKPMINSSAKTTRPTRIPSLPPINKRRRYVLSILKIFWIRVICKLWILYDLLLLGNFFTARSSIWPTHYLKVEYTFTFSKIVHFISVLGGLIPLAIKPIRIWKHLALQNCQDDQTTGDYNDSYSWLQAYQYFWTKMLLISKSKSNFAISL